MSVSCPKCKNSGAIIIVPEYTKTPLRMAIKCDWFGNVVAIKANNIENTDETPQSDLAWVDPECEAKCSSELCTFVGKLKDFTKKPGE
jgi:hypothetical protein